MSTRHPNVINLNEVVVDITPKRVGLVLEHLDCSLTSLIARINRPFRLLEVKGLMLQLLSAVSALHCSGWMHRDLKPCNILWSSCEGRLKVCDFGFAERITDGKGIPVDVQGTLWYRAPELLHTQKPLLSGGPAIDVWASGCIFAELILREPLFPGDDENEQLQKIKDFLSMSVESALSCLLLCEEDLLPLDRRGIQLFEMLLQPDQKNRVSAQAALNHSWFSGDEQQSHTHFIHYV